MTDQQFQQIANMLIDEADEALAKLRSAHHSPYVTGWRRRVRSISDSAVVQRYAPLEMGRIRRELVETTGEGYVRQRR